MAANLTKVKRGDPLVIPAGTFNTFVDAARDAGATPVLMVEPTLALPETPAAERLLALMGQDKKVKRGKLTFILLRALGQAVIVNDVDPVRVKDFLARKLG